ncbi:MAG TPA: hypothetical protein VFL57_14535 [Bryobacteraceae bacterium]|nr:hypothetical protein [Bryobacteraceae bacterium]
MRTRVGVSLLALLIVFGGNAFAVVCGIQNCYYPAFPTPQATDNASTNWSFELGADGGAPNLWAQFNTQVSATGGTFSQATDPSPANLAYSRIFADGGVAAYVTTSALAGAIYGATAAIVLNQPGSTFAFELFQGGTPLATGAPPGATLLASTTTGAGATFTNLGIQASTGATGGQPIWVRIRGTGGEIGVDAVLGTELPVGGGAIPEPFTMGLVGSGFLGLAMFRRIRR